jgi:hypothetical protein
LAVVLWGSLSEELAASIGLESGGQSQKGWPGTVPPISPNHP